MEDKNNTFERPKNTFKRYEDLISDLNDELITSKGRELNEKYRILFEESERRK